MNPNSNPPNQEFTDKALNAKFSFSFTRKELIVLINTLRPIQLPIGDMRSKILIEILGEMERTAITSITPSDYKPLPKSAEPTTPLVQTN